ncbi:MAG: sigma 54-interacting transcriptional regulator, partial [Deltaproteobacteria bacterium]|nr:sigma 54-interacting transcriptional regulator [Deltaproteobacteria bacterium]
MTVRLEVLSGEEKGKVLESDNDLIRIGRSESNDLVLKDWHVSGEHALVLWAVDRYVIRDLQSTNGTRLWRGGEVIDVSKSAGREAVICDGDEIWLGDVESPVKLKVRLDISAESEQGRVVGLRRVAEISRVEADLESDAALLRLLYEAQKEIAGTLEIEPLIDAVARQVFRLLPLATHVTVALREDEGDGGRLARYVPVGTRLRRGPSTEPIPISRSIVKRVVEERAAVLVADAKREVGETASIIKAHIYSTIGVPLWRGEEIIGVLQVDNRDGTGIFRQRDLDVVALLGQSAGQAFCHAQLYHKLRIAEERERRENLFLKKREEKRREVMIIGESEAMRRVFDHVRRVANTRVTVLIEGETGVGKELVASALHYWSDRRDRLFVAQYCAAVPDNLLE